MTDPQTSDAAFMRTGGRAFWLPYLEVSDVDAATEEAFRLGAGVLLAPREGPAGWRVLVATQDSGPLAFWQPKR